MPFAAELYEAGARIGLWNITESEAALRTGITLSPASMSLINASGSAKRRRELLAVRSLMHRMGISDNDLYYQDEKPMLRSGRFISISHSGTMACIALSAEGPVGVDIQEIKPRLSIVVRWLTKSAPDAAGRNVSLIRSGLLWTAREAMFKLAGREGVSMRSFHTRLPEGEIGTQGRFPGYLDTGTGTETFQVHYRVLEGYVLAVAFPTQAAEAAEGATDL